MKNKNYANAKDVLPEELLEQVREHFSGNLYIPGKTDAHQKRELIITLAKSGADYRRDCQNSRGDYPEGESGDLKKSAGEPGSG